MTQTVSTIPLVKRTLLAALRERSGLAEVALDYSEPAARREREHLWFGSTTGNHEISAIRAGRKSRNETFETDVYIYVWLPAGNGEEAEERCFELLGEVEDLLAESPQLGLTPALHWARVGAIKGVDSGPLEEGASAVVAFAISCEARLD